MKNPRLDPMVYIAAVATLVMVVMLACIVPTLRALRVQPVEVLRVQPVEVLRAE